MKRHSFLYLFFVATSIVVSGCGSSASSPIPAPPGGDHLTMSPELWEQLTGQWQWACDSAKKIGGEVYFNPKMSPPITQDELDGFKKTHNCELPIEFEEILLNHASLVHFAWAIDEGTGPKEFEDCLLLGGDVLWDFENLAEYVEMANNCETSGYRAFRSGLVDRIPFLSAGNGDLIAFDMRNGTSNCPIVYLSQLNDEQTHNKRLGKNIVDFLVNWSSIGCLGPEMYTMQPFYNEQKQIIDGATANSERFRKFLSTGK